MNNDEDIIISYGKRMLLQMAIVFVVSMMIGMVLRIPEKVIIFLVCLMTLRHNAGGVHMSSRIGCAIISLVLFVASAFFIKYVDVPYGIQMVTMSVSSLCIVAIAPVDNANNRLEDDERLLIRNRMIYILATKSIAFMVLYLLKLYQYSKLIVLATFMTCILVLIGKLTNLIKRGETE